MHFPGQDDFGQQGTRCWLAIQNKPFTPLAWRKAEQFIDLAKEDKNTIPFSNKTKNTSFELNYRSFSEVIQFNNAFFQAII